jgi:transcriptional regulator with XRE-family HTH domain
MPIMDDLLGILHKSVTSGKLTVAQIADACGCSRQYVYNLLQRKSEPTVSVAEKLAETVGFSFVLSRPKKIPQKNTA